MMRPSLPGCFKLGDMPTATAASRISGSQTPSAADAGSTPLRDLSGALAPRPKNLVCDLVMPPCSPNIAGALELILNESTKLVQGDQ